MASIIPFVLCACFVLILLVCYQVLSKDDQTSSAGSDELLVDGNCLVAVDVETSGLDPRTDRLLQWGISVYNQSMGTISTASTYLNHDIDVPLQASRVNGLTKELLMEKGSDPGNAMGVLLQYLSKAGRVVAYNAPFDTGFLEAEAERFDIDIQIPYIECTMEHAIRSNLDGLQRHRLVDVVNWINQNTNSQIEFDAHDAGGDAKACLTVQVALDAINP
jgi:DNA polymerase III epsilon subunit-like protein